MSSVRVVLSLSLHVVTELSSAAPTPFPTPAPTTPAPTTAAPIGTRQTEDGSIARQDVCDTTMATVTPFAAFSYECSPFFEDTVTRCCPVTIDEKIPARRADGWVPFFFFLISQHRVTSTVCPCSQVPTCSNGLIGIENGNLDGDV